MCAMVCWELVGIFRCWKRGAGIGGLCRAVPCRAGGREGGVEALCHEMRAARHLSRHRCRVGFH